MSRDVYEAALARHVRAQIATGALLQRRLVRSVDEDHVQPDPLDDDAADRLAGVRAAAEARRFRGDCVSPRREREPARRRGRRVRSELAIECAAELPLLPVRIQTCKRILPAPDDDRPYEQENAGADQEPRCDPDGACH